MISEGLCAGRADYAPCSGCPADPAGRRGGGRI